MLFSQLNKRGAGGKSGGTETKRGLKQERGEKRKPDQEQVKCLVPERIGKLLNKASPDPRARGLPRIYQTALGKNHPTREMWCAWVLNSQRAQFFHRKAHMKAFRALMLAFSNRRLSVSPSFSQKHLSCWNPCLPRIILPNIYPIEYSKVYDQPISQRIHMKRPLHIYTIKVTGIFWFLNPRHWKLFMLKAMCKHTIHTHKSLPPGWGVFGSSIIHRGKVSMESVGAAGCSALLKNRTLTFRLLNELHSLNLASYFWHQI